jgi:hypothetical protein
MPYDPSLIKRVLPKDEVARRLRELELSNREQNDSTDRVPIAQIATWVGYSRMSIYTAAKGEMCEILQLRLSRVLQQIEWGLLGFQRVGEKWQPVHSDTPKRPAKTRMAVVFTPRGPRLTFSPQSPPPIMMPTFASLLAKRR